MLYRHLTKFNIHSLLKQTLHKIGIEDCCLNSIPLYIQQNSRIMIYEKLPEIFYKKMLNLTQRNTN